MEYIEVTLTLPSAAAQTATDIAEMTDIGGIYLEDYSDMMDCELVKAINLVDEDLMKKDTSTAILHIYFEKDANLAGAMGAYRLISMTDINGILRDKDDPSSLISSIDLKEAAELFETGIISGGMIPKVQCCIDAIHRGVEKVFIMDGRVPHSLLIETLTDEGAGTMVMKERKKK